MYVCLYVCVYVWRIAQCSSTDFLKYRIPSVSKRETKTKLCASPHPMINFNNALYKYEFSVCQRT